MKRAATLCPAIIVLFLLSATPGSGQTSENDGGKTDSPRPIPYPVEQPLEYRRALERGTRSLTGVPGPRYWQQWTDYELTARLDPKERTLHGTAIIRYKNNSPDQLDSLFVNLYQNFHAPGVPRSEIAEVTGGVDLTRVVVQSEEIAAAPEGTGYTVTGTRMGIQPPRPVAPGESTVLEIAWHFKVPQAGSSGRMGWDSDNFFYIAYWYPQMAVYDDVVGWQNDWFKGRAEFYAGFGNYDFTVQVPDGWVVTATGELQNPEKTLAPHILDRLRRAEASDEIVQVITAEDFGTRATQKSKEGSLSWHFVAEGVRDAAFSVTRESFWDAARTPVGDRDGDGSIDYARVDALYRELAPRWKQTARYAQHSLTFLSEFTGLPYPWPHMTAVEGSNIIRGGMEFPMMTLIGDYNERGDSALYYVTIHEFAHMWVPMIVGNDEHRYSWMDEGTTSFNENQGRKDFYSGSNPDTLDQDTYLERARAGDEGEMMRRSAFHYTSSAFTAASYQKPASVLVALRAVLGEETFTSAYHEFLRRWAYKHPYPWDMFNTFASSSGRELDWFWRSWYYETWTLDHAIASVTSDADGTTIVIKDKGLVPMPVFLTITLDNGDVVHREVPVDKWLSGATSATVSLPPGPSVTRIEIDAERSFPDIDRADNVWLRNP